MTSARATTVAAMTAVTAPGQAELDHDSRASLRSLTARLLETANEDEYARYRAIRGRRLAASRLERSRLLGDSYAGKHILVTGGTGCIGSELVRQLLAERPASITCLHLPGETPSAVAGVDYVAIDIADEAATRAVFARVRPQIVFHCAAQRSPWLAEREVARTLLSNVTGTRSVLRAARESGVDRFVHASTGKAMRYQTNDVYAASKKIAEWLVRDYAAEGHRAAMARFTHVVDNAVVLQRVDDALGDRDSVIRVHDPELSFYAQSAAESATLLLLAGVNADTNLYAVALRDLGEPVELVDLVLGRVREHRATEPVHPAIYFSGFDRGYENAAMPGLYDPDTAGDLSPLINAVEARDARPLRLVDAVDEFRLQLPPAEDESADVARSVIAATASGEHAMRDALAVASERQAAALFSRVPEALFTRLDTLAEAAGASLPTSRTAGRRRAA